MKIAIASDHRGYDLKNKLINKMTSENITFLDLGTNNSESTDYPDFAFKLGQTIVNKEADYGIAICGSGIGISIACNKVKGIRCAKINTVQEAIATRNDNDANIIAIAGNNRVSKALKLVTTFIKTDSSLEEKHQRRIKKINEYEMSN